MQYKKKKRGINKELNLKKQVGQIIELNIDQIIFRNISYQKL
jgi:hypothetical protein